MENRNRLKDDPDIIISRQGLYSNYDSQVQEMDKKTQSRRKDRKLSKKSLFIDSNSLRKLSN